MKNTTTALLSFLVIALVGCSQPVVPDTVKVGWIGPLTGTGAVYGTVELKGASLALERINAAGGIDGKPIELVIEDGKCDGATAVTAAQKLIEVDGVKYILGGHCSSESLAILPITEKHRVLIMAGTTGSNKFTGAGNYSFRTFPSAAILYGTLAEYAYANGTRNVATLSEEKDWPQSVISSFAGRFIELGGTIATKETYASGTTDFRTQLLKIKKSQADAIMISAQGPDSAAEIFKQMRDLGMDLQVYADSVVISKATYDKSQGAMPPTAVGAMPHVDPATSPLTKEVTETFVSRYGQPGVDLFDATEGYDGMMILSELIKACGQDTDCARQKLIATEWPGATGTFRFNAQGDPNTFISIGRIIDGKEVFENMPSAATKQED